MLPRNFLILTPLKCREMHSKLINEILNYKLSVLEKRYRLTEAVADIYCIPKYLLLLSLRSVNSLAGSTRDLVCLFVLSLCLFNIVKLVNHSCVIVERTIFSIFGQWKTIFQQMHLLPDLPISLHTEITSLISFFLG